jgi:hypothetical protein
MCDQCKEDMTTIADRTAIPLSIVEEVYAAQKVIFRERDAAEAVEVAQEIASLIEVGAIDPAAMAAEQEADPGSIPGFIMEALVAGIGGPVVVIGARPIEGSEETGNAALTVQCGGTGGPALAAKMCASAMEALSSPVVETGGFTAEGSLVSPMRRRTTRPES